MSPRWQLAAVYVGVYLVIALVMPPIARRVIFRPGSREEANELDRKSTRWTLILIAIVWFPMGAAFFFASK